MTAVLESCDVKQSLQPLDALSVLTMLHSNADSVICFSRKTEAGGWENLGAIQTAELATKFPVLQPFLEGDLYFSINSMCMQRYGPPSSSTGLPLYSKAKKFLRYINAVAVDIDRHGAPDSGESLQEQFLNRIFTSDFPVPNLVVQSGRGLWALWLVHDELRPKERPGGYRKTQALVEWVLKIRRKYSSPRRT